MLDMVHGPTIPALWRLRQKDFKFDTSLCYIGLPLSQEEKVESEILIITEMNEQ